MVVQNVGKELKELQGKLKNPVGNAGDLIEAVSVPDGRALLRGASAA